MEYEESRAKTAPSKRKSWTHDSIELRTEDGNPVHVKAPGQFEPTLTVNISTCVHVDSMYLLVLLSCCRDVEWQIR